MTLAPLREAADSLAKASTPQPFSASKTSNWVARSGGLPDYIQHVAHGILRSNPSIGESGAIQRAIGVVKRWAAGGGGVDANTKAAAAKAVAEWEAKKAGSHAKVKEGYVATWADEQAAVDAALLELTTFEEALGEEGMIGLLAEGALAEAAAFSPTLKRTASASNEVERHEVYDGGQHVGTIARQRGYGPSEPDRHVAFAVNGARVSGYREGSRQGALDALRKHLEEAPARVMPGPNGKHLVATPESYGASTTYKAFSDHGAARYAAGLPPAPTSPEVNSKVEAMAEALQFDLLTVAHLDVGPLRRVQEARRADPLALFEAFDPDEHRGFHGRWIAGAVGAVRRDLTPGSLPARSTRSVAPGARPGGRKTPAQIRYEGGVLRGSAKARAAHARLPQLSHSELAKVGESEHSAATRRTVGDLKAGRVLDTQAAHRTGPGGAYSKDRQALHERIISALLQGKGVHEGKAQAVFTAGGPASGKSSIVGAGHVKVPHDAVHIDPDLIKSMLPEYQQLVGEGHKGAASFAHEESSDIAKALTRVALGRQHHILVDSVGDSGPGKFAGKIADANAAGHIVRVHYATVDTKEALRRADERGRKTGRFVGADFIRQAHQSVSQRFPEVAKIRGIHVVVHDTGQRGAPIIASKDPADDRMVIRDGERFRAFQAKARER